MDIAGLSVVMKNQQVRQDASFAVMNKVMDVVKQQGEQLSEMVDQSSAPHPTLGSNIDLRG